MSYIYIDKKRINSYYDQMTYSNGGEHLSNDFFNLWPKRVIESLKIEDPNKEVPCYSLYEKTIQVTKYIKNSNQFSPKRSHHLNRGRDYVYYEEELIAHRIKLDGKISLWISENVNVDKNEKANSKHGRLILVEGHSDSDTDIKFYGGYGTAQLLSNHRKIEFGEFDISERKEFNLNPIDTLRRKDYLIENSMKILVMYRVLSTCRDIDNEKLVSTLGYPITISTNNNTIVCNKGNHCTSL